MSKYQHDVFISHSRADEEWVCEELLPQLERAGLSVITELDFQLGVAKVVSIERAVENSRHTLVILTPGWVEDTWTSFESVLIQAEDPVGRQRRLIPLLLRPCSVPKRIAVLNCVDLTDSATWDKEMVRLIRGLGVKARIFVSYKRDVEPDDPLAARIREALEQAGHAVLMDKKIKPGVEWAVELERQIKACDFMIVLLSEVSVDSEMVAKEIECAHRHNQETNKSRILPVRVDYDDALPYQLSHYLDRLQYVEWHEDVDDERLIRQLLDAISDFEPLPQSEQPKSSTRGTQIAAPLPYADPRFIEFVESLREPSGAVGRRSEFYIQREADERLRRELSSPYGTTTTIRAPRQTGKSSLLVRGITQAKAQGSKVIFIDLQPVSDEDLESLESFLRYFATTIVTKLRLDPDKVEEMWSGSLGAPDKTTLLMERYVLPEIDGRIVLAMDEADRLLRTEFHDNFFGLIRYWHNSRALDDLWENLDIVMVISTEPHLLIKDVTQSPFNVGLKIRLQDFVEEQVRELNRRYRQPLRDHDIPAFMDFLGGHPYLTHKALYVMLAERITWEELTRVGSTESSPFGDHLRRYLWLLRDEPELQSALKTIISENRCPGEVSYYRLLRAGLIKGISRTDCACRCRLYEAYLKGRLS